MSDQYSNSVNSDDEGRDEEEFEVSEGGKTEQVLRYDGEESEILPSEVAA